MINENLNQMIMGAMKDHDQERTETYRAIKTAFMNWKTAKENAGKELTEVDEISILKKMVKQREESIEQYKAAGREDLAAAELAQVLIIKEFLPAEVTAEQIEEVFFKIKELGECEFVQKNMGLIIRGVKTMLPNADGKLVAEIVKKALA